MQIDLFDASVIGPKKDRELVTVLMILAILWLVLWVTGCAKKSETENAVDTSTAATTPPPAPPQAAPAASMTDANIIAALSEADSSEIVEARLALAKSKNQQVRQFAQMMITDHSKMKQAKADLAKQLNIIPQPPANDQEPAALSSELSKLNAASSPRAFDSIYISDAVTDHTNDLSVAGQMKSEASAPQLQNAISSALPVIQKHLDHAEAMQKDFSKSEMASGQKSR